IDLETKKAQFEKRLKENEQLSQAGKEYLQKEIARLDRELAEIKNTELYRQRVREHAEVLIAIDELEDAALVDAVPQNWINGTAVAALKKRMSKLGILP